MHSLTAYSIKVHDRLLDGPLAERYHKVDNIRSKDMLDYLQIFLSSLKDQVHDDTKTKKTIHVTDIARSDRDIYGWIEYGEYGIPGKIYSTSKRTTTYDKSHDDSDVVSIYYHFRIPVASRTGIAILHMAGNKGVKTFLHEKFNEYFKNHVGLSVQMPPLAHEKTVKEWLNKSKVKEIRLGKYSITHNGCDIADLLGVDRAEVTLKPKRGSSFGSFESFTSRKSESGDGFVEILSDLSTDVKCLCKSNRVFIAVA